MHGDINTQNINSAGNAQVGGSEPLQPANQADAFSFSSFLNKRNEAPANSITAILNRVRINASSDIQNT